MAKKAANKTGVGRYGWVPDLPDARDHMYAVAPILAKAIPSKVDLRRSCPPVFDQGQLGSCTANAIGAAYQFDAMKQKLSTAFAASRLFIYYNERDMEGTVDSDSGAAIRDGIKSIAKLGVCPETDWPYDITQFATKPADACYTEAAEHKALSYQRVGRSLTQMKGCLASGFPFVFGFTVYDSFESPAVARNGKVPMPDTTTESVLGGHAVLAVGYDQKKQVFIVRNSWGTGWGMKGYFTMPFGYLLEENLSDDFWTVRIVV